MWRAKIGKENNVSKLATFTHTINLKRWDT